ncbi:MAG TPA: UDP-glucose/GDP-mannose dehydrogenase family protein [Patescibacteria group bacterium]|nr:UDP-glucose/GDP-mannose dehydrogenase family protein [Patescibacteria group bacterium]
MHVTVIGTGFVGVVSAAVFASHGNAVIGLDIDPKRIESLRLGKVPFYEPGLEELLVKTQAEGDLSFTTDYEEAISGADVILIAVGTPSAADGQADLRYVFAACESLAPYLKDDAIVAIKSTVPPGTCDKAEEVIRAKTKVHFSMASLPEFLKEGTAVDDTMHPDRIVMGSTNDSAIEILKKLHKPFGAPIIVMRPESAQMCKYASNAYLATRITFINQIANLCEVNGANVLEVIEGIGYDKRIGKHYWYPGLGYGGSCFPKDVKELAAYAKAIGQQDNLTVTIDALNSGRIEKLMNKFEGELDTWSGKKVAVLGLSFKPNTDDMREAPSLRVIPILVSAGATVRSYDPMALESARVAFERQNLIESEKFRIEEKVDDALRGADAVILLVEWKELISLEPKKIAGLVNKNALFIDARDQYDRKEIEKVGMRYVGIGV